MTIAKAIARAWQDVEYKAKLLRDPHAALADVGVSIPRDTKIRILENSADTHHVVLPAAPDHSGQMSSFELEQIASTLLMRGNVG